MTNATAIMPEDDFSGEGFDNELDAVFARYSIPNAKTNDIREAYPTMTDEEMLEKIAEVEEIARSNQIGLYPIFVKKVARGTALNTYDFNEDTPCLDVFGQNEDGENVEYNFRGEGAKHIHVRTKQAYVLAAQPTNETENPLMSTKVVALKLQATTEVPNMRKVGKKLDAMQYACCFSGGR
ncbi:MAG: hypothetical protein LBB23_01160 [Rickettsiales bacterium]|jgi:hypothetical protein|nr:hypothetical protein [Rickettsiales bacterium]